jgi:hypothetical protein
MTHRSNFALVLGLALAASAPVQAQLLPTYRGASATAGNLPAGNDLVRYWLPTPGIHCNDGTQPVAHVRAATNTADADKWVIYLQGGGTCDDGEACLERWQSAGTDMGLQKMGTSIPVATWNAWHPGGPAPAAWPLQGANYQVRPTIAGVGIQSTVAANPFRTWNHVHLYYCSSDQWTGQQTLLTTEGTDRIGTPAGVNPAILPGTVVPYQVHFHGALIFDAFIAELRSGVVACRVAPPFSCERMPDLDVASKILLAGSSAGGNGVKQNLDHLSALQAAINPATDVRGAIDAAGNPSSAGLPWPLPPARFTSYQEMLDGQWFDTYVGFWNARVDASCVVENPLQAVSRCADTIHIMRHHITTPFFHRMDQQDNLALDSYTGFFFLTPPFLPDVPRLKLSSGVVDQLTELSELTTWYTPRYPNELATIVADATWVPPGTFGPRCGDHVGLHATVPYFNQEIQTPGGAPVNLANALFGWVNSGPAANIPLLVAPVGAGPIAGNQCN